jgi:hypothetical protein
MVKHQTRKVRGKSATKGTTGTKMGLKKLRSAFDHMEKVVNKLKPKAKHSFQDAVSEYRSEWQKVFKRDIPPAEAASYLKFRFGLKGTAAMTRRGRKMHGGALPISGAPLDYTTRAGVNGVYGNFPSYQQEGLDRYYNSALSADCNKSNGFPTDGSRASQTGGGMMDALFRPVEATAPINSLQQVQMVDIKGVKPFPSSDPVGTPPLRSTNTNYITNASMASWARSYAGSAPSASGARTGEMYGRT